jgi:hypothetical protein
MTRIAILIALAALAAGCTSVGQTPITGLLYNEAKGPSMLGDDAVKPTKTGTACAKGVLGVVWGDSSLAAAKQQGAITRVNDVDHEVTQVLFVYAKYCTVVRGE